MTDHSSQKQCVITGAANGIGLALARRFARAGYAITGLDVDAARAAEVQASFAAQNHTLRFVTADLADPDQLHDLAERLGRGPAIDVFIHNAGINAVGRFQQLPLAQQRAVLEVNLLAPLQLTAALLRHNRLKAGGSLVFISSLSRYVSYPGAATYAASKDGLASYARSLSVTLTPRNINVLTVYPGPTRTAHARRHSPDNRTEANRMKPDHLADQIFEAVQARRRVLVPGLQNKLFALLGIVAPRLMEFAMRKTIYDKLTR